MASETTLAVLDSSVGVKWIKPEQGRDRAMSLLGEHRDGRIRIVVASHFMHEVVGVAVRHGGPDLGERVWSSLRGADLTVIGLDDIIAAEALQQCRLLGCTFYDGLAPAIAARTGAVLYSADARAHSSFEGVELMG